jgi:hypothetical protein
MRGLQELTLPEAVRQIRATCDRHERPFFFLVGAGVSHPRFPWLPPSSTIAEAWRKSTPRSPIPRHKGQPTPTRTGFSGPTPVPPTARPTCAN